MSCYGCLQNAYRDSGFFYISVGMSAPKQTKDVRGDDTYLLFSPHHPRSQSPCVLLDRFLKYSPNVVGEQTSLLPSSKEDVIL